MAFYDFEEKNNLRYTPWLIVKIIMIENWICSLISNFENFVFDFTNFVLFDM